MRKFVYLCVLVISSLDMAGQANGDRSWTLFVSEEFNRFDREWGRDYVEVNTVGGNFRPRWQCFYDDYWPSCVTLNHDQHHVFQRSQCLFNDGINYSDGVFRIVAERIDPNSNLSVGCNDYEFPEPSHHWRDCSHHWLYYYSGCIETIQKFLYGYFEIRCKNPVHQGAFPAFWLWGNGTRKYEEIDIYEYMWDLTTDTLLIDYIKVYKLDGSDCDVDAIITNSLQLANHDHKVKHSISIGSSSGTEIIAMTNSNITMRAVESIVIEGPFSTQQGSELTMMVHSCPDD